ncbi:flavin-dependent oxidoreductase [Streptomyces iconiensis]|uniref:Flavin-dependent oxidoreductase n=1 Tax=Streptomyces iconiensis TaxID=1384038 RepID=A0ABT7A978_9ACTN|nr:flavin-dependent oxidoreductase [Streptomyces iconiensis]MDJ1137544.1 flavin-dependent oxidoreductase [Streptomyces iconiensis]
MEILIAGAGVGGLTAALSLHAAGFERVRLVETAPRIAPLGVGLNILPSAVRELDELGLYGALAQVAVPTGALSYYNRFGSLIWNERRGLSAGYRWPQLSVHRGALQRVLADAVRERLGPDALTCDARVEELWAVDGGRVTVGLSHPMAGGRSTAGADVLIGADGIRSGVRAAMYPDEGDPPWNGLIVWRGITWAPPFLDGRTMIIAGDLRRRAVVYPMSAAPNGRPVMMNWAVARAADPGERLQPADWNRAAEPAAFLGHFADLDFAWLDVPGLVRGAEHAYVYPMVDRDPLPRWTAGRATLLGDAAHAMYPMGSNGATQSIIDARVLARALATHEDADEGLAAYELERRPPATRLQEKGRKRGPEIVIDMAHERAPEGFDRIEDVIPPDELANISALYAQLGAFDPETVNNRPTYNVPLHRRTHHCGGTR